jgi:RNA polymerase sigma-70 factor (ECF subfamily)
MSADEDQTLVERARRGEREAFGQLVRKYQRRVYQTAFHITGRHGDADDAAQEAFVRAWRAMSGFDSRSSFFTWLYRITVNVALNQLRGQKRRAGEELDERLESAEPAASVSAEERQLLRRVLLALAELPESLRLTLVLAAVEDLPYREIAELMACPEGTVAWRVNQARKQLRARLADLPLSERIDADALLRRARSAATAP